MQTTWKPSDQLISLLKDCDIDSDIIDAAIANPLVISLSHGQLGAAQNFTRTIVEQNISWGNFTSRPKSLFFSQGTYLRKDWKPKEATITLILDELKLIGRVEIAEYKLSFLEIYKDQKLNSWDSIFIKFVLDIGSEYRETQIEKKSSAIDEYPKHQQIINKILIRRITNQLLKTTYISPYFNKPLDDSWRPSAWVVKKLENEFKIGKGFILHEAIIRKPFISFQLSRGGVTDDYDVLYFEWVSERQSKYRKLRFE